MQGFPVIWYILDAAFAASARNRWFPDPADLATYCSGNLPVSEGFLEKIARNGIFLSFRPTFSRRIRESVKKPTV
jgi:hypothetical protein